ncbi:MAG: FHA domain-containing protein [Tannerellaceae bacterium]|jgi:pSer/pThr/pTyr-binding forkhead associated (FHA) protein|nr:FHA domain-containing protein [Tannerellaceae bacterium]
MIRIGKAGDNDAVVAGEYVSRYHALLSPTAEGEWMLEDNHSTNGTFVNGGQILRRKVKPDDRIMFGGEDCVLTLSDILHAADDYSIEFEALKETYATYLADKVRIQSSNVFKVRLLQTLPFAFLGIGSVIVGTFGKSVPLLSWGGMALMIGVPLAGIYLGARQSAKIPGLLQEKTTAFRATYACPKCKTPFGEQPWEALAAKRRCPTCKAHWKRDGQ